MENQPQNDKQTSSNGNGGSKYPAGLFVNTSQLWAPFKMSFEGFAGGGKTFTECCIAIGLWQAEGKKGDVFLVDTEKSAKFIVPFMTKFGLVEGKNLFVSQTRNLLEWGEILKYANETRGNILMTDTVSHIYEEMMLQFEREKGRKVKYPGDAMVIKPMWKERFATPYVNAQNCHNLFTGRAAWEYTMDVDDDGKKTFNATGVKMRGDNEIAYEPDVVVYMERLQKVGADNEVSVARGATIMKDRSRLIDGKSFVFRPLDDDGHKKSDEQLQTEIWAAFEPVYKMLSSGNRAMLQKPTTDADRSLGTLFQEGRGEAWYQQKIRSENIVEEIGKIFEQWGQGGSGAVEKSIRASLYKMVFNNRTTTKLAEMKPEELEEGSKIIEHMARYASANAEFIEQLFKTHEQEKLFDYLQKEADEYRVQLHAPEIELEEEDDVPGGMDDEDKIPDFGSGGEEAKIPEQKSDLTSAEYYRAQVIDIETKINEAGTTTDVDVVIMENAQLISAMAADDRTRLNKLATARKRQTTGRKTQQEQRP